LKLKYDGPPSYFAFSVNLRRYHMDKMKELKLQLSAAVSAPAVEGGGGDLAPATSSAKHDRTHRETLAAEASKRRQGLAEAEVGRKRSNLSNHR